MSEIFQTFIHRITVFTNYIAIQYALCENLPIPETPAIMRGSNKSKMVRLEGFEPSHPVPETKKGTNTDFSPVSIDAYLSPFSSNSFFYDVIIFSLISHQNSHQDSHQKSRLKDT